MKGMIRKMTCYDLFIIYFNNSFPEIHEVNLRTLTERHVTTFQKQLINLLFHVACAIRVKLGEINMIPLIILNKTQIFITG